MFCTACGKEIREGALFCTNCGAPVKNEAPAEQPVAETPVVPVEEAPVEAPVAPVEEAPVEVPAEEAPVVEAPAEEAPAPEEAPEKLSERDYTYIPEPQPVAPEMPTKPKKKKKFLKWLIPLVAVVAAIALVLCFLGSTIEGFFLKTFSSDEKYYTFVEEKSLEEGTEAISDVYGAYLDALTMSSEDAKANSTLSVTLGEKLKDLIKNLPVDLSWIDGAQITSSVNVKDGDLQLLLGVKIGKSEPMKVEVILESESGDVYVGFPSSEKEYLKFEGVLSELDTELPSELTDFFGDKELLEKLQKALPTEKELNTILNRYVKAALGAIGENDITKSKETLEIGDVALGCTRIDVSISEELAAKMAGAILAEVKKDKDIEKIVTRLWAFAEDADLTDGLDYDDAAELYEDLLDGVDDLLEEMEDMDVSGKEIAVLTSYVNGSHEVIGRALEVDDEEVFFAATVEKGGETATKMNVYDVFVLEGEGTKKGNLLSGTYAVTVEEEELLTIELKDFNEKKAEDGYLEGTIRLKPTKDLLSMFLPNNVLSTIGIADPALEFVFNTNEKKAEIAVNLLVSGDVFFGIRSVTEEGNATAIATPDKTVDALDEEKLGAWVGEDPEAFLESIGLPQEILDVLKSVMGGEDENDSFYDPDYGTEDVVDVSMMWKNATSTDTQYKSADMEAMFGDETWEPGTLIARNVKIENNSTCDVYYTLELVANGEVSALGDVIDVYFVGGEREFESGFSFEDWRHAGTLTELLNGEKTFVDGTIPADLTATVSIAFKMSETAGNEYGGLSQNFSTELFAVALEEEEPVSGGDAAEELTPDVEREENVVADNGGLSYESGAVREFASVA